MTERLRRICGVSNFLLSESVPLGHQGAGPVEHQAGCAASTWEQTFTSFRVTAKRADKRLPLTSMDVEREVGAIP